MRNQTKTSLGFIVTLLALVPLAACGDEADDVGDEVEDAVEEVEDAAEDLGD